MQLHRHENRFIKIVATICFLYTPMKITMDETTGLRRSTNLKTNEEKWQLRVMRRSSALLSVVLKINIDTLLYPESSRCCATPLAHCIFILDQNTQIWICNSEAWSIMTQWQRQRLHSVELSINRGGGFHCNEVTFLHLALNGGRAHFTFLSALDVKWRRRIKTVPDWTVKHNGWFCLTLLLHITWYHVKVTVRRRHCYSETLVLHPITWSSLKAKAACNQVQTRQQTA